MPRGRDKPAGPARWPPGSDRWPQQIPREASPARLWCDSLASKCSKLRSASSTNQSATPFSGWKSMVRRCDHGIALHASTPSRREIASATCESRSKSPESPWCRTRIRPGLASSVSQSDTSPAKVYAVRATQLVDGLPPGSAVTVSSGRARLAERSRRKCRPSRARSALPGENSTRHDADARSTWSSGRRACAPRPRRAGDRTLADPWSPAVRHLPEAFPPFRPFRQAGAMLEMRFPAGPWVSSACFVRAKISQRSP